ncbi:MAG: zinc ribbon domain-containing protein [Armatimonadetes bacterium]|nr:zinc ribbon domain-containing protein [Armatimonadota bacterium]
MNFTDRVATDPLAAFSACAIWIPIVFVVVTMVGWMIAGEVETLFGLACLGIAVGSGILASNPPVPGLAPWLLASMVATIVLFPIIRAAVLKRALVAIDIDRLERAFEALQARPNDAGAAMKIAEVLFIRGMPGQAIVLAERALAVLPKDAFREEARMVERWKGEHADPAHFRPLSCLHCGNANPVGELYCTRCGRPYLVELARGRWMGEGSVHQILAVWVCLMFAFLGLPVAAQIALRSVPVAAALAVSQVVLGLGVLVWAFRKGGHREAA